MSLTKIFSKSADFSDGFNVRQLYESIRDTSGLGASKLKDILCTADEVKIIFKNTITSGEDTLLQSIVDNYTYKVGKFVNIGQLGGGDFGLCGSYVDNGVTKCSGIYRNSRDNCFTFFDNLEKEPITTLDIASSANNNLSQITSKNFNSEIFAPKHEYFVSESKSISLVEDTRTRIRRTKFVGCCQFSIINDILNGPCGFFAISKSNIEYNAAKINLSNLNSKSKLNKITNNLEKTKIFIDWEDENNIEIAKTKDVYDGDYLYKSRITSDNPVLSIQNKSDKTLSGTTYIEISTKLIGNEIVNICSKVEDAPNALFYISKNDQTKNSAITKLISSNGSYNEKIELRWLPNTGIEIHKNSNNYDGLYEVTTLIDYQFEKSYTITLTNTDFTNTTLIRNRERISTIVSVSSTIVGAPSGIFIVSKNIRRNASNILCIVHCRSPTKESLQIVWNANEKLKLKKTGSNYNGTYTVKIFDC